MAFDISSLTCSRSINELPPAPARIVRVLRFAHFSHHNGNYCGIELARRLGGSPAVRPFHAFLEEFGHASPQAIRLNQPCRVLLTHDEALIADIAALAARAEHIGFARLLEDMLAERQRALLWIAARRLMRGLCAVVQEE